VLVEQRDREGVELGVPGWAAGIEDGAEEKRGEVVVFGRLEGVG